MPSPFPGMNPYLEHPELWPGVHHYLIAELARFLSPQLRPKYRVAVEVRMVETMGGQGLLVGVPDLAVQRSQERVELSRMSVAVAPSPPQPQVVNVPVPEIRKQGYLEVREIATKEVVTAIEILSPANKRSGKGRNQYESKRNTVFSSSTHLVEIDLLRKGEPMLVYHSKHSTDYRILVSRGDRRPQADWYGFNLRDRIPSFPLPLKSGDTEPLIDLQTLLDNIYDTGSYDLVLDYAQDPVPPLSESDRVWLDSALREQNLRA
ncbi:DUF4058 family protein [Roseofilum sp. BLCC_M154]|uniref:DUF4058 family protein n=1 Tax=Roseofilum acuticapitatum BLCC-M154 TaxID=3022444 RepID=A0ABT7AUS7_9CYAN|nr:DUF4058 family protein [Roseofilum acuticapitatum]MDJ1170668.1 DUF4058 family protein [Roseofilum acuticapitatum BLCC-M154]